MDDVETLASLANQAAIAIENARLQERLRELAVVAERERIAREMHDGLAQVLGYVNTKSQAVEAYLATGRWPRPGGSWPSSPAPRAPSTGRPRGDRGPPQPDRPGVGLVGAVEEYVRRFAEASKIAAVVETSPEARLARLAPEAEAQAFRIVQESLTNVRKHAGARRAALEIEVEGGSLLIRVSDDGRGLAAADGGTPDWPRYGLQAMRERAAAIGGSIDWTSHPGSGVTVRIAVPLAGGGEPHADRPRRRPHALSRRCRLAARGWGHEIVAWRPTAPRRWRSRSACGRISC